MEEVYLTKEIVKRTFLVALLDQHDLIMADRGNTFHSS